MKIAVLSDIHSNVFALKAVLEDVSARQVDAVVNLGDTLYGPIAPRETYRMLNESAVISISGNQDRQIYESTQQDVEANPTLRFILDDLGPQPLEWMKSLPFSLQLTSKTLLCHGTPQDDLIYLLEDVSSGLPRVRDDKAILELLGGVASDIVLCGHTHVQRCVKVSTGQLLVNPGSVGLPAYTDDEPMCHSMQSFSHHASYAIVDEESLSVELLKVDYDYMAAAKLAGAQNRMDWVHFISTGRGL